MELPRRFADCTTPEQVREYARLLHEFGVPYSHRPPTTSSPPAPPDELKEPLASEPQA